MDSRQIEELASQWLARRDGAVWSDGDEAELQAWLNQSTAHLVAFVRLEAAWKQAKRLKALSNGVPPGEVPAPEQWQLARFFDKGEMTGQRSRPSVRGRLLVRVAASLMLAVVGAIVWYVSAVRPDHSTPVGGVASVPMSDGSKVTLNTDSQIRIDVTESERRVELQRGEAFFEVAKDPSRPFVVTAGGKRVIAVGTAFSVRRNGNDVQVAITEGRVRIEDATERQPMRGAVDEKLLTLAAGSVARATDDGVLVQDKPIPDIESDLSWRTGYLIFRDVALADAVAEFNRYTDRKIVIDDPAVATIRLSGKFRSTQFDAFVRLLEQGFPVRAERTDDRIVLVGSRRPQ
ncbi:FecR family protein [Steroidobacter flavus]|uniref:FecR family protein n=1 Tax=Steroidobacter flavus TaxID=1842136 RepID=A0ABV8T5E2_9GAMM